MGLSWIKVILHLGIYSSSFYSNLRTKRRHVVNPPVPTGGWVHPRHTLDIVGKRKIFFLCQESNPRTC